MNIKVAAFTESEKSSNKQVKNCWKYRDLLLFCQPRVEVTSCFVYKVMELTFHDRINTHLIYRIELAQLVARRITKPIRKFLGSNLTGCSFFIQVFFQGGGGLILLFSSCLIFL